MTEEKKEKKYDYDLVEMSGKAMSKTYERMAILGPFLDDGWEVVVFRKK